MATLKGSQELKRSQEIATVKFIESNDYQFDVVTLYSNVNRHGSRHQFHDFLKAREFYWQILGALYCDGWR